jgi:hypothetical protein
LAMVLAVRKEKGMRLEIRRHGVEVTDELRAYLKERLRLALGRFTATSAWSGCTCGT